MTMRESPVDGIKCGNPNLVEVGKFSNAVVKKYFFRYLFWGWVCTVVNVDLWMLEANKIWISKAHDRRPNMTKILVQQKTKRITQDSKTIVDENCRLHHGASMFSNCPVASQHQHRCAATCLRRGHEGHNGRHGNDRSRFRHETTETTVELVRGRSSGSPGHHSRAKQKAEVHMAMDGYGHETTWNSDGKLQ